MLSEFNFISMVHGPLFTSLKPHQRKSPVVCGILLAVVFKTSHLYYNVCDRSVFYHISALLSLRLMVCDDLSSVRNFQPCVNANGPSCCRVPAATHIDHGKTSHVTWPLKPSHMTSSGKGQCLGGYFANYPIENVITV